MSTSAESKPPKDPAPAPTFQAVFPDGSVHDIKDIHDADVDVDDATPLPPPSLWEQIQNFINNPDGNILYQAINPVGQQILSQFSPWQQFQNEQWGPQKMSVDGAYCNWSENQVYMPQSVEKPSNLKEVEALLEKAYKENRNVIAVGGAYGFSPLVSTRGGLVIDTSKLNEVIDINISDKNNQTVTVQCGIPIINITQFLYDKKKILPTSPIFAKISAAGGCAVGVHGTGRECGALSDYIVDMTVVNVNKEGIAKVRKYTAKNDPEHMKALLINIGALGFVYSITFKIFDNFNLHAKDEHIPMPADEQTLAVFMSQLVMDNDYVEIYLWPNTDFLWIKKWNKTDLPPSSDLKQREVCIVNWWETLLAKPVIKLMCASRNTPRKLQN